jgi:hypothetical protein
VNGPPRTAGSAAAGRRANAADPQPATAGHDPASCRAAGEGEVLFLPTEFRSGADLEAPGDMAGELAVFLAAGRDGFFTDNPELLNG